MQVTLEKSIYRMLQQLFCIGLATTLMACAHQAEQAAPVEVKADQNLALTQTIAQLQRKVADLEIQLLQKEALVIELQRRALVQQKRLDSAITEVVRTKSKFRSLESKAEAASVIAEAEIAVASMKKRFQGRDAETVEELFKAERLLRQSSVEFKTMNYGGALYLAVQAKNQVRSIDPSLAGRSGAGTIAGETVFDQPLSLKVTKTSNLRQGPDMNQPVVATLPGHTAVMGIAFRQNWIRVETESGQSGWVHQSLVKVR